MFPVLFLSLALASLLGLQTTLGYGGWGPGEGFGHTGQQLTTNTNGLFGFDQLGILQDRFNYSSILRRNQLSRTFYSSNRAAAPAVEAGRPVPAGRQSFFTAIYD